MFALLATPITVVEGDIEGASVGVEVEFTYAVADD